MNLLGATAVIKKTSLSRSTLWRLVRAGRFPAARQLGPNRIAWVESEVDAWIKALGVAREPSGNKRFK